MLSLSNASLLSPPALSGAEGEAEGYAKTIWRPAASTLSKTGTGQASSAQVLGRTRRARAAGISPTKKEPFPLHSVHRCTYRSVSTKCSTWNTSPFCQRPLRTPVAGEGTRATLKTDLHSEPVAPVGDPPRQK